MSLLSPFIEPLSVNRNYIVIVSLMIGISISLASAQQFKEPVYTITGAEITGFEIDSDDTSLIISLEPRTKGELIITLPRNMIDAKVLNQDIAFVIIIDGFEMYFLQEIKTDLDRTLTIPVSKRDNEIIITGTQVFSRAVAAPTSTFAPQLIEDKIKSELRSQVPEDKAKLLVFSDTTWSGAIEATGFPYTETNGRNDRNFVFVCENFLWREGGFGAKFQKNDRSWLLENCYD